MFSDRSQAMRKALTLLRDWVDRQKAIDTDPELKEIVDKHIADKRKARR